MADMKITQKEIENKIFDFIEENFGKKRYECFNEVVNFVEDKIVSTLSHYDEDVDGYIEDLNNKISEYEERLNDFISVKSKAKMEFENMKDRFRDVNLNEYIKVKLTDKGKEIYRNYWHDLDDEDVPTLDIDEEGFCKFQLWEFMKIFGEHFRMCGDLPCETNVKIQIREK